MSHEHLHFIIWVTTGFKTIEDFEIQSKMLIEQINLAGVEKTKLGYAGKGHFCVYYGNI